MNDRWILNQDLWEEVSQGAPESRRSPSADDLLWGQDADRVVTIFVTRTGEFVSAKLAADWRRLTAPRQLSTHVISAANNAAWCTAAELDNEPPKPHAGYDAAADESPITVTDVLRLIDAVYADLDTFSRQVLAAVDSTVSVESDGGHVRATARGRQLLDIAIDTRWCGSVRYSEIEYELTDVLQAVNPKFTPTGRADWPQSLAISELQTLTSDPHCLLRRLGLNAD